ncbi:MAG: Gfo/Idh/MocA family oxidoreductase [Lentisphaerae bacterium]|nr:Gfo/Idh/MocA family oxidoreductase [Lentisphaerota bacterium]
MTQRTSSDRIRLGFVGVANMGMTNLKAMMQRPDVAVTAVCDVDRRHLEAAKACVDAAAGNTACRALADFRELDAWSGVDAVVISTPDHWHVPQAIHAALCGKDIYLEKPLTLSIAEGRRLCRVIAATGRVLQTGSQQRSMPEFRRACEMVRNSVIGTVQRIEVGLPPNNRTCPPTWSPMPVPPELDYDAWLGPAPWAEYHEQRCHYQFRFILDYSGGQVTNFGAHHLDIVQWALGMDDSGPCRAWGRGQFPSSGLFTTATEIEARLTYANGVEVEVRTGSSGVTFRGTAGTLSVQRGRIVTDPPELAEAAPGAGAIGLYRSDDHHGNWLDCIRERRQPVCPVEVGHRSATCCHLANLAMRLGRELTWDPQGEVFVGDDEANAMLERPGREPWASAVRSWTAAALRAG